MLRLSGRDRSWLITLVISRRAIVAMKMFVVHATSQTSRLFEVLPLFEIFRHTNSKVYSYICLLRLFGRDRSQLITLVIGDIAKSHCCDENVCSACQFADIAIVRSLAIVRNISPYKFKSILLHQTNLTNYYTRHARSALC